MKNLYTLFVSLFLYACQSPAYAIQIERPYTVEQCATYAWNYSQLVEYKDFEVSKEFVLLNVVPRLHLPGGSEKTIENILDRIYEKDLTQEEVFHRMYNSCIIGYSI